MDLPCCIWMGLPFLGVLLAVRCCQLPWALGSPVFAQTSEFLPLGLALFGVVFMAWRLRRNDTQRLERELNQVRRQVEQVARERDVAQEELFRRLYEEREHNKEKVQFQAQMGQYEKYAALARLALGAAHEINNPLLGILSHLELELKATQDSEVRTEVEQCIAGAKRISTTLRGLVNYARPGPLLVSKVSLHRLVVDTLGFLEGQPMLRGKILENQVPADLPMLHADATQLSQVLMNLLLNAAEATPEGGKIMISAAKLTYVESIEVRIADTGAGISAEVLPHVFEPFFTTKLGKGTGLGLSISEAYVRSHNGEIRADSVLGHGTTITITLPLRQPEQEGKQPETSEVVV